MSVRIVSRSLNAVAIVWKGAVRPERNDRGFRDRELSRVADWVPAEAPGALP
jgi:hypothetical protein